MYKKKECEKSIALGAKILKKGGLVSVMAETVYGLAADSSNLKAVRKIYSLKKRPTCNPLIIHVNSIRMAEEIAFFTKEAQTLASYFSKDSQLNSGLRIFSGIISGCTIGTLKPVYECKNVPASAKVPSRIFEMISLGGKLPKQLQRELKTNIDTRLRQACNGDEDMIKLGESRTTTTSSKFTINNVACSELPIVYRTFDYDVILGECTAMFLKYPGEVIY